MSNITEFIPLPYFTNPCALHFGISANYERLVASYFIKKESSNDEKFINKHIIIAVKYFPDDTYEMMDGMWGKCWLVTVVDNENDKLCKYYVRNWIEIVHYYEEQGLIYVQQEK